MKESFKNVILLLLVAVICLQESKFRKWLVRHETVNQTILIKPSAIKSMTVEDGYLRIVVINTP